MKNRILDGVQNGIVDYTNASGSTITAGTVVQIGSGGRFGVVHADIPNGKTGAVYVSGRYRLAKATGAGTDMAAGHLVGFDTNTQLVVKSPTAATIALGFVHKAVSATDAEVEVDLAPVRVPAA